MSLTDVNNTWFIPAFANNSVGSSSGITDEECQYVCSFSLKKSIKILRISFPVSEVSIACLITTENLKNNNKAHSYIAKNRKCLRPATTCRSQKCFQHDSTSRFQCSQEIWLYHSRPRFATKPWQITVKYKN